MSHPTPWAFHPGHHPSYIDFFEQVLAETTDPAEIGKYEEAFATDPWYVHLYRTGNASTACTLSTCGLVRARPRAPGRGDHRGRRPRRRAPLGFKPASTMADALEMASDVVGRDPSITHLHSPRCYRRRPVIGLDYPERP